ncbi:hypothetical protein ARSEF1564_010266 [Beauveria bassiana]
MCNGTAAGSQEIRCEWENVDAGDNFVPVVRLKLGEVAGAGDLIVPLNFTVFTREPSTGKLQVSHFQETSVKWTIPTTYRQADSSIFPQPRAIAVSALPKASDEQARLRQYFLWSDFQCTGFYLNAGLELNVTVSGVNVAGPKPEVLVGTPALLDVEHPSVDMEASLDNPLGLLDNGHHALTHQSGGILYIRYVYEHNQTGQGPVTVTLGQGDAAQPFPLFREGVTTDAEWKSLLAQTTVPFAEHDGERVIITGLAARAKEYADRGQDQNELLRIYARIIAAQDAISGLNKTAPDARDRPSPLRPMVVQANSERYADATDYRAAIGQQELADIWWGPQLVQSWKIWHELGHHRQHTPTWSWEAVAEATVNIYSLAARRLFSASPSSAIWHATAEEWEDARKYLALPADARDYDTAEPFNQLVMFEQLRVAFGGDELYHQLHRRSRALADLANITTDADKKHFFMTQVSEIFGSNLGAYFTAWGLKPEQRTLDEMGKQPDPVKDYTETPVYD